MPDPARGQTRKRSIGRRKEDRRVRDQVLKYGRLYEVGQIITSSIDFDVLFEVVMNQTNQVMDCERSSVFLHDSRSSQLFSLVATGIMKNDIRIPDDHGIAGWVFQNKRPLVINDAYADPRFYPEVDKKTGFKTRNILCIPLVNKNEKCVGALQALNKASGEFTEEDRDLLTSVSHYVAIAYENSRLYEELKTLDKAKERVINHLAHELKTPLAVIAAVLGRFSKNLADTDASKLEKAIKRGKRNLNRLIELQEKIDDILNHRSVAQQSTIIKIIENAADFVEELAEENSTPKRRLLDDVSKRIDAIFSVTEPRVETVRLSELLHRIRDRAVSSMGSRNLEIVADIQNQLVFEMEPSVLDKVIAGLLKNAIENTPDQGRIEIRAGSRNDELYVDILDYGVGITDQNQALIFGGFFHTQETDLYASKKPYAFNAGGTGSDLLRTKVFSERYGFSVDFESTRCKFLPGDKDVCPGKISECPFTETEAECRSSGGSLFSLKFPLNAADRRV